MVASDCCPVNEANTCAPMRRSVKAASAWRQLNEKIAPRPTSSATRFAASSSVSLLTLRLGFFLPRVLERAASAPSTSSSVFMCGAEIGADKGSLEALMSTLRRLHANWLQQAGDTRLQSALQELQGRTRDSADSADSQNRKHNERLVSLLFQLPPSCLDREFVTSTLRVTWDTPLKKQELQPSTQQKESSSKTHII